MCSVHSGCYEAKRPNLKLKTQPKQPLGYISLHIAPRDAKFSMVKATVPVMLSVTMPSVVLLSLVAPIFFLFLPVTFQKIKAKRSFVKNFIRRRFNPPNVEESHVNKTLDGCMYPGYKLVQFITVSEKHFVNKTRLLKPGTGAGASFCHQMSTQHTPALCLISLETWSQLDSNNYRG